MRKGYTIGESLGDEENSENTTVDEVTASTEKETNQSKGESLEKSESSSNTAVEEEKTATTVDGNPMQIQEIINVLDEYSVYFHNDAEIIEGQLLADMYKQTEGIRILALTDTDLKDMGGNLDNLTDILNQGVSIENNTIITFVQDGETENFDMAVSSFDQIIEQDIQAVLDGRENTTESPVHFLMQNSETINKIVSVRTEAIVNAEKTKLAEEAAVRTAENKEAWAKAGKGIGIALGGGLGILVLIVTAVKVSKAIAKRNSPEAKERRKNLAMSKLKDSHNIQAGEELALNIELNYQMKMENPSLAPYALDTELLALIQKYNRMRELMKKKGAEQGDLDQVSILFSSLLRKLSMITGKNYYISSIEQWWISNDREKSDIAKEKSHSARRAIEIISEHIDDTLTKFDKRGDFDLKVAMKSIEYIGKTTSIDQVFENQTGLNVSEADLSLEDDDDFTSDQKIEALKVLQSLSPDELNNIIKAKPKNNKKNTR